MQQLKNGDNNIGVLAYKGLLAQLKSMGIITASVDRSSGFGGGTHKATEQLQRVAGLDVTGVADTDTIKAARGLAEQAIKALGDKIKRAREALE